MKTTLHFGSVACLVFASACVSFSASIKKTVEITTTPPGAEVSIDGTLVGSASPTLTVELRWENKRDALDNHTVKVEKPGFEARVWEISNKEANVRDKTLKFMVTLLPLTAKATAQFSTQPKEAEITLSDGRKVRPLDTVEITFKRSASASPWAKQKCTITAADHAPETRELEYSALVNAPLLEIKLERVRREISVNFTSSERGARVTLDKKEIGAAPLTHPLVFTKDIASQRWDTHFLVIAKDGFRAKSKEGIVQNPTETGPFTRTIRLEDAEAGEIRAELEPIKYLPVPVYQLSFSGPQPGFLVETRIADVSPGVELFPASPRSDFLVAEIMDTRIWVMTNSEQVIYSCPRSLLPPPSQAQAGAMGGNGSPPPSDLITTIRAIVGKARKQVTDGRNIDIDPCSSPDDQLIYFSSNRGANNRFVICAVQSDGTGGIARITDSPSSVYDLEPTISSDGKRLAFTRLEEGKNTKYIWICDFEKGREFLEICPGENPSWSPDAKKLAIIAMDNNGRKKLMLKDPAGGPPTTLTVGDHNELQPCWTPDGKHIVYCSDESIDPITGIRNWDIYMINSDGLGKRQLTNSISHDQRPFVSPNGKYVYFLSNRGAKTPEASYLQIWRIEIPSA